jgi:hypothetical protein
VRSDIPTELSRVVLRCLAKDRGPRPFATDGLLSLSLASLNSEVVGTIKGHPIPYLP